MCGCDFSTTFSNTCEAHFKHTNVASNGSCDTPSPSPEPTGRATPGQCGRKCEGDDDCQRGGFVQCPYCDLGFQGTQTYKTCIERPDTTDPTPDPTPAPITTPNPTLPPIETSDPTPAPVETDEPTVSVRTSEHFVVSCLATCSKLVTCHGETSLHQLSLLLSRWNLPEPQ